MKQFSSIKALSAAAIIILSSSALVSCTTAQPVTSSTPEEITAAVNAGRWVFIAERSDPPIGRSTNLSTGYEVRCSGDTAVFNLPYAGQMQGPARFPGEKGPLDFTSTDFSITTTQLAQGKWRVVIQPKDAADMISGTFIFFDNGEASLDVLLRNRTPMDFFGKVEPLR